ncbi:MAG: hypothetical protein Kow00127_21580 [Bacteroidales bacterium]
MKVAVLILLLLLSGISSPAQQVCINEVMAENGTWLKDNFGDYSDWIELCNKSSQPVNLAGYGLSDDPGNPFKWQFASYELMPDSFLIVYASGKNLNTPPYFHTGFKLSSEGEEILLTRPNGELADIFVFSELAEDLSAGRRPDASDDIYTFEFPSPGRSNLYSNTLTFSHYSGLFSAPFNLTAGSISSTDTIRFTSDGRIPGINDSIWTGSRYIGFRYNEPNQISMIPTTPDSGKVDIWWSPPQQPVDKATVLRFRAFHNQQPASKVYSLTFFVDSLIVSKYPFPLVSVITDPASLFDYDTGIYVPGVNWTIEDSLWTGNYYQKGSEWERRVNLQYFDETGLEKVNQEVGIRIHGKQSRRRPQKTLRIYAREEYHKATIDYPLLPHRNLSSFSRILLTGTYNDWHRTMIKDQVAHSLVRGFGFDYMDYRPVVLFVNGEYWGIQTFRDYYDEDYLAELYDVNEESIDLLANQMEVISGSSDEYEELLNFIENNDLGQDSAYNWVASKIDIDNFINYQIAEIFLNNIDWPGSNVKYWKSDELDNKWRWIFFDLDAAFGNWQNNMMEWATIEGGTQWPNPDWSTFLLRNLLRNDQFKQHFLNTFSERLYTSFQSDTTLQAINYFRLLYEPELARHMARWNFPESYEEWLERINFYLSEFAINRPCSMASDIEDYFEITDFMPDCSDNIDTVTGTGRMATFYPNPVMNILYCRIDEADEKPEVIWLYDLSGRRYSFSRFYNHQDGIWMVDLSALPEGFYITGLLTDERFISGKILKLKK